MKEQILVIDDDVAILQLLRIALEREGFRVLTSENGPDGLKLAFNQHPDLVLLDLMLPGMDGFEVCRRLLDLCEIPIIMLTALAREADVVRGLTTGADDYVTKPFHIPELVARIRTSLRRHSKTGVAGKVTVLVKAGLTIDVVEHRVTLNGKPVHLTPTEFSLLSYLAQNAGRVIPHKTLLIQVWGPEYANETEYLHLYIRYLRNKIERNPNAPEIIKNERGLGYYLEDNPCRS